MAPGSRKRKEANTSVAKAPSDLEVKRQRLDFRSLDDDPSSFNVGFTNRDHVSCYKNAPIQCLLHLKPIVKTLLNKTESHLSTCVEFDCFLCELLTIIKALSTSANSSEPTILSLDVLSSRMSNVSLQLDPSQQEDASWFTLRLVQFLSEKFSSLEPVFNFKYHEQLKCSICNHETSIMSPISKSLIVRIPSDNYSLTQAIHFGNEVRDCIHCKHQTCHFTSRRFDLSQIPRVLIISLNNVIQQQGNYITTHRVCIEKIMTLTISDETKSISYMLKGVVVRHGDSSECGHYTAFCLKDDNYFYLCNDEKISPVPNMNTVLNCKPQMVFYERIKASKLHKTLEVREETIQDSEQHDMESISSQTQTTWTRKTSLSEIGKSLCYPVSRRFMFIKYETLKTFYESSPNNPKFPFKRINLIDYANLGPCEDDFKDCLEFLQVSHEFTSTAARWINDEKEFFQRREGYLQIMSFKLFGGVFLEVNENLIDESDELFIQDHQRPMCEMCNVSFRNCEGAYLHLIAVHSPLQLLHSEELTMLGLDTLVSNYDILTYNKQLAAFLHLMIVFRWKCGNKRMIQHRSIYYRLMESRLRCLTLEMGNKENGLQYIPDDILQTVDPLKCNITIYPGKDQERLYEKFAKCIYAYAQNSVERAKQSARRYLMALVDKDVNLVIEKQYGGDIGRFLLDKSNKNTGKHHVILYAGRCYRGPHSVYHFSELEAESSYVSKYWQTGKYFVHLVASEPIAFDANCGISHVDQVAKAELQWIILLKMYSIKTINESTSFKLIANQHIGRSDSIDLVGSTWINSCISHLNNVPKPSLFCSSTDDANMFQIKILQTKLIKSLCERKTYPQLKNCSICMLPLPSDYIQTVHKLNHRNRMPKEWLNCTALTGFEWFLSNKMCLKNNSCEVVKRLSHQAKDERDSRSSGIYILCIDMLETNRLSNNQLDRELQKFIATGLDLSGRPERFQFYVGKNYTGPTPSLYHLSGVDESVIGYINGNKYFIKGISEQAKLEYQSLLTLFLRQRLNQIDHIRFANKKWDKCSLAVNSSTEEILYAIRRVCRGMKIFCTVKDCVSSECKNEKWYFENIHLEPKNFSLFQGFDEKLPLGGVKKPADIKMTLHRNDQEEIDDTNNPTPVSTGICSLAKSTTEAVMEEAMQKYLLLILLKKKERILIDEVCYKFRTPAYLQEIKLLEKKTGSNWACKLCNMSGYKNDIFDHVVTCFSSVVRSKNYSFETNKFLRSKREKSKTRVANQRVIGQSSKKQPSKQIRYCCTQCKDPEVVGSLKEIKTHIVKVHDAKEKCFFCGAKSNTYVHILQQHLQLYYNYKTQIKCNICNHVSISNIDFDNHMVAAHEATANFNCPICMKGFQTMLHWRHHAVECNLIKLLKESDTNLEMIKAQFLLGCTKCSRRFFHKSCKNLHKCYKSKSDTLHKK